ncbi:hypothetical protein BSPA14S_I0045 (plasmid) [Borreliella spielmanii A14S]|uniref:Uncharacterized protein n=1 Tax=Borreliella spielmanii A14S TaxID=498742 RepID=C0RCC4_9SPIR|nr:hypothetical protein BSPA14S_I0045 [Borreliella spielmanii A14S]
MKALVDRSNFRLIFRLIYLSVDLSIGLTQITKTFSRKIGN